MLMTRNEQCPTRVRPRPQDERLAQQHEQNARDHRIPHVPVGAVDHEVLRRVPRRQRTLPTDSKLPERRRKEQEADAEAGRAEKQQDDFHRRRRHRERHVEPACQPRRDDDRHGERQDRDGEEMTEDHGGSERLRYSAQALRRRHKRHRGSAENANRLICALNGLRVKALGRHDRSCWSSSCHALRPWWRAW